MRFLRFLGVLALAGIVFGFATNPEQARTPPGFGLAAIFVLIVAVFARHRVFLAVKRRTQADRVLVRALLGVVIASVALTVLQTEFRFLPPGGPAWAVWGGIIVAIAAFGGRMVPGTIRRPRHGWFGRPKQTTHGSAHFGTAANTAQHFAPNAPPDTFVLGRMPGTSRRKDTRFRQDGHVLTCAPTGAGKGIGAVIPNLLEYPGSAFVLDLKGENYAVTARARRELGQDVFLVDPFGVTGVKAHALNWLDALDPASPDVVSRAGALAEMLIAPESSADPHWNDTARELLRGLLIHVAGLPSPRRTMAELRRLVTAPEDELAETFAAMAADPEAGQRIPARAAVAHLNRPERERGSVLSTLVRHTAWLDDPRLCAALERSDFVLADLKQRPMTVYLVIPPSRLRACRGFVRGFVGMALDSLVEAPRKPVQRVALFLDEIGQLGRLDRLADAVALLRGYGVQLWLFVQDLSQLQAVYPRWQSFLANTSQQFFGTADYDTARYLSEALGRQTIRYETRSSSASSNGAFGHGSVSGGTGEVLQGRSLLTPDEVMRLGPTKALVLVAGEPPYLLDRLNYLTDPAYAGCFDPNPMHLPQAVE